MLSNGRHATSDYCDVFCSPPRMPLIINCFGTLGRQGGRTSIYFDGQINGELNSFMAYGFSLSANSYAVLGVDLPGSSADEIVGMFDWYSK